MMDYIAIQAEIFCKGKPGFICKELQKSKIKTISGWGRAHLGTHFLNLISGWLQSDDQIYVWSCQNPFSALRHGLNTLLNSKESFPMGSWPFQSIHIHRGAVWKLSINFGQHLLTAGTFFGVFLVFFWLRTQPCYLCHSYSAFPLFFKARKEPVGSSCSGTQRVVGAWVRAGLRQQQSVCDYPLEFGGRFLFNYTLPSWETGSQRIPEEHRCITNPFHNCTSVASKETDKSAPKNEG